MINWNDLKNLDLKNFDMPKFDMPKFDMPEFDLPGLPEFDLPADAERVVGFARDAAYASVGAVVIGVQHAEARRRELSDRLTAEVRKLVDTVA